MPSLPYALGALALTLAGIIGFELRPRAAGNEPAGRADVMTPPARRMLDTPDGRGAGRAEVALARPLFSENRRPASLPPPSAATPASLPRLTGTLIGPFGRRALFVEGSSGKPFALVERDRVGAWTVEAISEGHVTLRGPDGARSVRVGFKAPPPADQTVQASSAARRIRRHNRT
jgi:hypothetical protein